MSRRRRPGWIPVQHGAWAFLIVPFVVGMVPAGVTWTHLPLAIFWLSGYLAFQACAIWLKSRRAPRFVAPLVTYASISAAAGVVTAVMEPSLLVWVPAFLPGFAVGLWAAWRRNERTLIAGLATALAACLMTLVSCAAGSHPDLAHAAWCAAIAFGYFAGTVLYVKTMIRERGQARWYWASVAYHAALTAAAIAVNWWVCGFFALITARAAIGPRRRWQVRTVGLGEVAAATVLTLVLLLAPLPA